MNKRKIIISAAGLLILAAAVGASQRFSSEPPEVAEQPQANKALVRTMPISNGPVQAMIEITGRVVATEVIDLFAEVGGVSAKGSHPFKVGTDFARGQVLLRIDNTEYKRSLASAKSQFVSTLAQILPDIKLDYPSHYPAWYNYLTSFEVNQPITALPTVNEEQFKLFLTGRNVYATYYTLLEREERLSKYIITAPFSGSLTQANINLGALVRVGQNLGQFMINSAFELEASVSYDKLQYLNNNTAVTFTEVGGTATYNGTLIRINKVVDPTTQLVTVFYRLNSPQLKSGLYLEGQKAALTYNNAAQIPVQALIDGTHVYTVQAGKAVKHTIEVKSQNATEAIVTGLKDGDKLIIDKKNSAFEGSEVIEVEAS